jgi:hypothetical protein
VSACSVGYAQSEERAKPSTSKQDKPVVASSWIFEEGGKEDDDSCYHRGFLLQAIQEPWSQLPASTRHADLDWCDGFAHDDCNCCSSIGRAHNHSNPHMGHFLHVDGSELVQVSWLDL